MHSAIAANEPASASSLLRVSLIDVRSTIDEFRSCLNQTDIRNQRLPDKICGAAAAVNADDLPLVSACLQGDPISIVLESGSGNLAGSAERVFLEFRCAKELFLSVSLIRDYSKYRMGTIAFIAFG
ncbi:hypothetical protein LNV23_04400 [Paucibacter sp. DJ1R-11]|uniref:hypothetical protein n=1 Tax=Paucibacter sp. DJ1R-11 TaxID=2893556 RepID=UPI0021E45CA5|nr:hypothetical protein [Paucibacter sp. DJ1R-11]MCV2362689.1 hypothetical protein [Paucibacter sp. DJ1R-11]